MTGEDELGWLLERCAAGEEAALHRLYTLQAARLKGLALRITGNVPLAEDVVHDVFLHVWQEAHRFDPQRGTAAAWLTTLARFRAMEVVRSRGPERAGLEAAEAVPSEPEQLLLASGQSDQRRFQLCLGQLDPAARRALILAFLDGRTHVEIASLTATKLGTLKSLIRRSLRQLRGCMEG